MTQDLFQKSKTHKEMLLDFIRDKHWVRTSEVIRFASDHFSNRGDRDARQLCQEGKIRRLSKQEKIFRFGGTKEDIWEIV